MIENEKLIAVARMMVGDREISPNRSPTVDLIKSTLHGQTDVAPYCVDFVRYCALQVDQDLGLKNKLANTRSAVDMAQSTTRDAWLRDPIPGSIIVWRFY